MGNEKRNKNSFSQDEKKKDKSSLLWLEIEDLYPPKVKAMYEAVLDLFASGRELSTLKVAEITAKAGIGKGTAYEYFATKEEIIIGAIRYEATRHFAIIINLIEKGQSFQEIIFKGLDMMEASNEKYGGFALMEKILRDSTITGNGLLEVVKKYKRNCDSVKHLTTKVLELATNKGLVQETDSYKVWSAILSQFVAYGLYLTHQNIFPQIQKKQARTTVYENIIKLLN